ncbi:hypothetical protein ACFL1H_06025 [Nanoarchaeota archaeon]
MATKTHTLEKISKSMKKFDEEELHTAMFLAFAQSTYNVMSRFCIPSPIYRFVYDETNNQIKFKEPKGEAFVPESNALDISVIDEIFLCNVRDIPLLMEGETGVGKTYPAMKYLNTLFSKENFCSQRLSGNAFLNNLFSHFQEGTMVNGMPQINAKVDAIHKCASVMTDEINRGDSNETLQLFDNEMHLGGLIHKLGIPIPEISIGNYNSSSGKLKKLLLVSAQNPANVDDAKFTGTLQLDAAVDNRMLKTYVGNSAQSAGTTYWLNEGSDKSPHDIFLEDFTKRASKYLGINKSNFDTLKEDWLSTYAWVTDSSRTDKPILYSALELSDFMIAAFGQNIIKNFNYEKDIVKWWGKTLGKKIEIKEKMTETETVKNINKVIDSFQIPIIPRDIIQIERLSDVLSTLKSVKDAFYTSNPVKTYTNNDKYVTVREITEATALLARNKQKINAESPINTVNQVLTSYVQFMDEIISENKSIAGKTFDLMDHKQGVKKVLLYKAFRDTLKGSRSTVDTLINQIVDKSDELNKKIKTTEDFRNILLARFSADLLTLAGFINNYKSDVHQILKSYDKNTKPGKLFNDLSKLYFQKKHDLAIVFPEIYQHRIQRTLGM